MNKKIFIISLMVVSLLAMALPFVFANVDVNISGTDYNNIDTSILYDNDAVAVFNYTGFGSFNLRGLGTDNTGYPSYGVDSTATTLTSDIVGGGFIQFAVQRLDSYEPMYGDAVQSSYAYITSSDVASLDFRVTTNYASLGVNNYGWSTNDQFTASGNYTATHSITNGANNAGFLATGTNGTLDIDHMTDGTWGTNSIVFGAGGGCYTNANVDQTGSGTFVLGAHFENSFTMGTVTAGGAVTYSEGYSFTDGFSWTNYSFSGN